MRIHKTIKMVINHPLFLFFKFKYLYKKFI